MTNCNKCKHLATKFAAPKVKILLYGCRLKRINFGTEKDFITNKFCGQREFRHLVNQQPDKCKDFVNRFTWEENSK